MVNILTKIFGSKHDKDIKRIRPLVDEINNYFEEYNSLSDEEIRAKTDEFKANIKDATDELETEKASLEKRLQDEVLSADEIADINAKLKVLDQQIFDITQEVLDSILTKAYAVVKQVCQRLTDANHRYEYAGQSTVWAMVPYDVQLIGAVVLHEGKIAEMATGEGKTLVAIMPLYLNSLPGKGAHLVTVNDYLAVRDCEWMKPVYDFLGVTVSAIKSNVKPQDRTAGYSTDITYGTNNEFGFDYLRDNMVIELDDMVQRGHWFAIVDEVDSVLIDEARTPLIISGPVGSSDQSFDVMKPRVKRLVDAQNKLVNSLASEAAELLGTDNKEDREKAGMLLLECHRGLPKHKRLAKILQEPEYKKLLKDTELDFMREQGRRMRELDEELFYTIDEKNHGIDISEKGRNLLINSNEDPEMFVIPDIAAEMSQLEVDTSLDENEKQLKKDEFYLVYSERSDRIHTISQLLRAYSLYEKDVEYVIENSKIMIVDEFTGRILEGRRYSEGLHQAIEAKEGVKVERDTQTLATITLQNYFRLYKKLAGMTGTAETEAGEFEKIYSLDVTVIPTNRPITRVDEDDLIYRTKREKYNAIIDDIQKFMDDGRAILVGTATVEVSEVISKMLQRKGIRHNVLNAKQHQKEAEIIQNAGRKGALTIATNMAGRGTDIKLDPEVKANGGLAIVGSERHDARRIDRQLRGRSGRQGDPGSSQFYISLEDNLMRLFGGERIANVMQTLKVPEGEPIQHSMITKSVEKAQKKVEENNFGIRKRLLEYDDVMNQQREVIYTRRKHALRGERLRGELFDYIEELTEVWMETYQKDNDYKGFMDKVRSFFLCEPKISEDEFSGINLQEATARVLEAASEFYNRKEKMLGSQFMKRLEQVAVLQTIDDKWRDHLRQMDDLKEGIHLRAYGQKNPILEYKGEAYQLFVSLIQDINADSVNFAFKYFPKMDQRVYKPEAVSSSTDESLPALKSNTSAVQYEHSSEIPQYIKDQVKVQQAEGAGRTSKVQTIVNEQPKIGRNQLVKVQYNNGKVVEAKYKKVEQDIQSGNCRII